MWGEKHYNGLRKQLIQQGQPTQAQYSFLSASVVVLSCPQLERHLRLNAEAVELATTIQRNFAELEI